ncbi:LexA family transcriptional regulator [Veillonella sp. VA142]|uniref:LexA family protein n=1 Tax=Veillonella sp. VA142 TaxID=741834 RepID=UPI000F8D7459|nr:XRE family transcriptional regulator [Veillonella sp. VA142]
MSTIGQRIKELRLGHNMTGYELGLKLNITRNAVSQWETNKRVPTSTMLTQIAKLFNVTTDYLLGREEIPNDTKSEINYAIPLTGGVRIPVLGSIVAGIPNTAVTDYDEWIEISQSLAMRGEYFALRIKGDSMEPTLFDSDIVVIRQQPDVEDGEIAAVSIAGNEATIKRIYHRSDGIDIVGDNVRAFPRMFYSNHDIATLPVRIMGKAVEVRRDL